MKKAVAIKYNQNLPAPFVIAKGRESTAEKILAIARDHGIYVYRSADLADKLIDFDINQFIPEECYEIIAEILIFVRSLNEQGKY